MVKTSQPNAPGLGNRLNATAGPRLPVPPRERKPALAAVAVILILVGALASGYLVMQSGQRVSAIQISQPVAAGQQITKPVLTEVQIGNTGIDYISWDQVPQVLTAYAAVPLVKGSLLTNAMLYSTPEGTKGRVVVGLALKAGQLPMGGLRQGQHLSLYSVAGQNSSLQGGLLLANDAIITYVSGGPSTSGSSDVTLIDVAIPPDQAQLVVEASSAGAIASALLPAGVKVSAQQPPPPQTSQPPKQVTPRKTP